MVESVRLAVVGDGRIGKTSACAFLVSRMVGHSSSGMGTTPAATVGVDLHVGVVEGIGGREGGVVVEMLDLSGEERYIGGSGVFLEGVDGVVVAIEASKSSPSLVAASLHRWLGWVLHESGEEKRRESSGGGGGGGGGAVAPSAECAVLPVLLMATKADTVDEDMKSIEKSLCSVEKDTKAIVTSARTKTIHDPRTFSQFVAHCLHLKVGGKDKRDDGGV